MKINVQLFGSIGRKIPGYNHTDGIDVEIPDGSTAEDVLIYFDVPEIKFGVVLRDGNVLKLHNEIYPGDKIAVLETMTGG